MIEDTTKAKDRTTGEPTQRDDCAFCRGAKRGVPGNENIIGGVIVCDYCTALLLTMQEAGGLRLMEPRKGRSEKRK